MKNRHSRLQGQPVRDASTSAKDWAAWATARPEGEPADLCIVNTCTVTVEGDAKSRKLIRQVVRQNPAAEVVVMGCYATRAPEELAAAARRGRGHRRQTATPRVARPARAGRAAQGHLHLCPAASGLRQGPGRLLDAVQLLHHPPRPAGALEPPGTPTSWTRSAGWSTAGIGRSC